MRKKKKNNNKSSIQCERVADLWALCLSRRYSVELTRRSLNKNPSPDKRTGLLGGWFSE